MDRRVASCAAHLLRCYLQQHPRTLASGFGEALCQRARFFGSSATHAVCISAAHCLTCPLDHQLDHTSTGCSTLRAKQWAHYRQFHTPGPLLFPTSEAAKKRSEEAATAEECDRIVEELRYRNIAVPKQLDISWSRRIATVWRGMVGVTRATFSFVLRIPSLLLRAMRMTWPEWKTMLGGWWETIKHEGQHYWVGFRLFGFELRVASRLVWRQLNGKQLTRRERKQLTRTTADIFRMVPFTLFIIIPFAELLLPVALKLFPNMLPSTFQTQLKQEEELKKLLVAKTELARFLQQTVGELAKDVKHARTGQASDDARALVSFLKSVRAGADVSNKDIMQFATLFKDEITLDNLDRVHLVTLCQFLSLNNVGTTDFLRMRLRAHLNELKADDIEIKQEGVDTLTDDELRQACRARGMPAPFGEGCTSIMRSSMEDWIELSLDKNIPQSLLLLSRAFKIKTAPRQKKRDKAEAEAETVQSIKDTLGILPEETIQDVEMESFKSTASMEKRLEYLRREEEHIKEEAKAAEEMEAARRELEASRKRLDMVQAKARATAKAVMREATARALRTAMSEGQVEVTESESQEEQMYKSAAAREKRMRKVIEALAVLASASGVSQERALFMEVAKDEVHGMLGRFKDKGGSAMLFTSNGLEAVRPTTENKDTHITEMVSDMVSNILIRVEQDLDRADSTIGEKMHLIDTDNDGIISRSELQEALSFLKDELTEDEMESLMEMLGNEDTISVQDLEGKLRDDDKSKSS